LSSYSSTSTLIERNSMRIKIKYQIIATALVKITANNNQYTMIPLRISAVSKSKLN
jgi:hypothetical protein